MLKSNLPVASAVLLFCEKVLSERIRIHVEEMIAMKELPKGSYALLREALLIGEFQRGKAQEITGFKDRAPEKCCMLS